MKLLNPLHRNICHLCCVDFFHSLSFLLFSTISRYFPHFYLLLFLVNTGCGSCGRCFLVFMPAFFGGRVIFVLFCLCSPRRLNGLVLLVIGGRSNACCAFLAGLQYSVLPLIGCATSFTCAGHFLAFMSCF